MSHITRMLHDVGEGRPGADEELANALYEELRRTARRELAGASPLTVHPTAIVHEAWMRLFQPVDERPSFENRAHFFASAARTIRRVLIDHARRRGAEKRGGDRLRLPIETIESTAPVRDDELLAVSEALDRLSSFAPDQARIVELRFFGGMTNAELATVLETSESTIERRWRSARAWLRTELEPEPDDGC